MCFRISLIMRLPRYVIRGADKAYGKRIKNYKLKIKNGSEISMVKVDDHGSNHCLRDCCSGNS